MKYLAWTALLILLAPAVLASTHGAYSEPRQGFSATNGVSVDDTAVYKTGYISENGSDWQAFTLSGSTERGNWTIGTATADTDLSNIRYVAAYSCTWNSDWDCSETWQVLDRGEQNTVDSKAGDEAALQALYASTNGQGWDDNTGWSSSGMDLNDEIFGVTVEDIDAELRVTEVNLNNNGLAGNIEVPELGNLKQMRLFAVSINDLYSTVPQELGSATNLEYLYLSRSDVDGDKTDLFPHEDAETGSGDVHPGKRKSNEANVFHGPVPASLGNLHKLKWITLSWTDSEEEETDGISSLPEELFDIRTFEGIQLFNNNNVADLPFPQGITQMSNLTYLAIGVENSGRDTGPLTGDLPTNFGDLSNLKHLRLGENPELRTEFDEVNFSGMISIRTFSLGNTDVRGSIPDSFFDGSMPELIVFGVSWPRNPTGISGPFPEVDPLMDTHVYQFNRNSLTSLPASAWTSNTKIIQPNFRDNDLTTIGTADLTQQDRLRYLRLGGNELHEPWPYLDWDTIAAQGGLDGVDFDRNRYVFKHMLYIPPNGDKPIIEHYEDMIDADSGNAGLDYSPQKPFGQAATRSVSTGGSITLDDFTSVVEHPDNEYQWRKDGSDISGAASRELTISDAQASDAGEYVLVVTNPGAPDLTLTSEPVTLSVTDASTDSVQGDHDALMALYQSTNGDSWDNNDGWETDPSTMGSWYGVETYPEEHEYAGRVRSIKLNGAEGWNTQRVDPYIEGAEGSVGGNSLTGTLPQGDILANLKHVTYFNVKNNQLTGELPDGLFGMTDLQYLYLNGRTEDMDMRTDHHPGKPPGGSGAEDRSNNFEGPIPPGIGDLQDLRVLELTGTGIQGDVGITSSPPELNTLSNLQGLHLAYNSLDYFPDITQLSELIHFAYYRPQNDLSHDSFPSFENLSKLRYLRASDLGIRGGIPDMSNSAELELLVFAQNDLTGELPAYLFDGTLPDLATFTVAHNDLSGEIPPLSGVNLGVLGLGFNDFSGTLPEGIEDQSRLILFGVADNNFHGEFPADLSNMYRLRYIRAYGNNFTGTIPLLDTTNDKLKWLWFSGNSMSGEIPAELAQATNLPDFETFDVRNNRFSEQDLQPIRDALQADGNPSLFHDGG